MRISESRMRQIIREEAVRVLREQAAPVVASAPAAPATDAVATATGMDEASANQVATTISKLLQPNPLMKQIFPGGAGEMVKAIKDALVKLGAPTLLPMKIGLVVKDMIESAAIEDILKREIAAKKKPLEIVFTLIQKIVQRVSYM